MIMQRTVWTAIAALGIIAWGIATGAEQNLSKRFYQAIRDNDTGTLVELTKHADVNVKDARGATPLMYAAIFGTVEQVKLLLDAGADCNAKNSFDGTALICARGDMAKSQLLMEHGADANARSEVGHTPLMAAAGRDQNMDLARLLLAKGSGARAADKRHTTSLLVAAAAGNVEMMRLLIGRGADVNQAGLLA
jgi:uncharacterized protein